MDEVSTYKWFRCGRRSRRGWVWRDRFKPGDQVCGTAIGIHPPKGGRLNGGFREYTLLNQILSATLHDSLSFTDAVVTPLGLSTAACALYQKDSLGQASPSLSLVHTGGTIIIWGGSTSVGSNAIQLAVVSGYEVVTTASTKKFDDVKYVGASHVFDYKRKTSIQVIIRTSKDKKISGALSIGELRKGHYKNVPAPEVVGNGIDSIQSAIDIQSQGVSQKKSVITMQLKHAESLL